AKIARVAGVNMAITNGRVLHPLGRLGDGGPATWFIAPSDPVTARKRWLAGQLEPAGSVYVDVGAERALTDGKSLLPAGVVKVSGEFDRGDAVVIRAADGTELGRGLVGYAAGDATRIMGRKSGEIAGILGHKGRSELVHRDDMALNRALNRKGPT
ncbi:MAG: PUA domain-containing protein, partial [Hyphomicrobiaceae bacterium]